MHFNTPSIWERSDGTAALLSLPLTLLPLFTPYNLDSVSFIFLYQQQEQKWLSFLGKPARALVRFPDHLRLGPDKPLRTINLHQVDVIEDI
jgi:hypothetical protein